MKKVIIYAFVIMGMAISTPSLADICVAGDADFDPESCEFLGGTIGTPLGQSSGPGSGTPPSPDPTGVPIDGGMSLVLACGIGYGYKQLKKKKNAKVK